MHLVFTELFSARAVFIKSNKVLGWQPGAPKSREHDFPKNVLIFLKFIEPLTPLWVLQPSQNMHMVSTGALLARAVFAKQIKVRGWQPGAPKSRGHDFPKKNVLFFEIHRTSDNSLRSAALPNHAYGLYGIPTNQSSVYKVN